MSRQEIDEMCELMDEMHERIDFLEDFIADLHRGLPVSGKFAPLDMIVLTRTKRYRVWIDLHLKKYPENY